MATFVASISAGCCSSSDSNDAVGDATSGKLQKVVLLRLFSAATVDTLRSGFLKEEIKMQMSFTTGLALTQNIFQESQFV